MILLKEGEECWIFVYYAFILHNINNSWNPNKRTIPATLTREQERKYREFSFDTQQKYLLLLVNTALLSPNICRENNDGFYIDFRKID